MSFILLIIGIVLSVIAALTTLILSIIALATGKQRNGLIYGVAFIMSIILAVLSIIEVAQRGSDKVKQGISWIKEMDKKNNSNWDSYDSDEVNYYAYIPEENNDTIANSFYNSSENGAYYIPLVFPYRFASNDMYMNFASLEKMNGTESEKISDKDTCLRSLQYISHFTFDDNFLLAKRDNKELRNKVDSWRNKDIPDYTYILFDFSTGKCDEFFSESSMKEKAKDRGFNGKHHFDMTSTHYFTYSTYEGD